MFYREHKRLTFNTGDRMITKQSHKNECDIHNILKQYQKTGIINHISKNQPQYINLPDPIDYQQAIHTVMEAEDAFASLPSAVRDHFNNDPEAFLRAFTDKSKESFLREHGLLKPKEGPPGPSATPLPATSDHGA